MYYNVDVYRGFFHADISILNCLFSQIHSTAVLALLLILVIRLGQAEDQQVQVRSAVVEFNIIKRWAFGIGMRFLHR